MPSADELAALPRKELQALAKTHGVKANQKNDVIIAQLLPLVASTMTLTVVATAAITVAMSMCSSR